MKRTNLLCDFVSSCNKNGIKISVRDNYIVNFQFFSLDFRFENKIIINDKCLCVRYEYLCNSISDLLFIVGNSLHRVSQDFPLNNLELSQFKEYQRPELFDLYSNTTYDIPFDFKYKFL